VRQWFVERQKRASQKDARDDGKAVAVAPDAFHGGINAPCAIPQDHGGHDQETAFVKVQQSQAKQDTAGFADLRVDAGGQLQDAITEHRGADDIQRVGAHALAQKPAEHGLVPLDNGKGGCRGGHRALV